MVKDGLSVGSALRAAKLEMIDRHPRHWAAFVLWGLP